MRSWTRSRSRSPRGTEPRDHPGIIRRMTQPSDIVRAMFAHHLWATETLIDHLAGLPAERLDETIPGTYGSMVATLTHLVDADGRYLVRFEDPSPPPAEDRTGVP